MQPVCGLIDYRSCSNPTATDGPTARSLITSWSISDHFMQTGSVCAVSCQHPQKMYCCYARLA